MNLDYDKVMSFLAGTTPDELMRLANNPALLEKSLSQTFSEDRSLEPDTPEAQDAATADGNRDDRAEETIYQLLQHHPKTWETFKAAANKLAPDSAVADFLDRYQPDRPQDRLTETT